jgi:hypothetical protein
VTAADDIVILPCAAPELTFLDHPDDQMIVEVDPFEDPGSHGQRMPIPQHRPFLHATKPPQNLLVNTLSYVWSVSRAHAQDPEGEPVRHARIEAKLGPFVSENTATEGPTGNHLAGFAKLIKIVLQIVSGTPHTEGTRDSELAKHRPQGEHRPGESVLGNISGPAVEDCSLPFSVPNRKCPVEEDPAVASEGNPVFGYRDSHTGLQQPVSEQ